MWEYTLIAEWLIEKLNTLKSIGGDWKRSEEIIFTY